MAALRYLTTAVRVSAEDRAKLRAVPEPEGGDPERIRIEGKCPRCRHDVEYLIQNYEWGLEAGGGGGGGAAIEAAAERGGTATQRIELPDELADTIRERLKERDGGAQHREVTLQCNCATEHKGADGKPGCGAWFGLRLEWERSADGKVEVNIESVWPITHRDIQAALDREARYLTQLTRIRAVAGELSKGLIVVLGLIPTAGAVATGIGSADDLSRDAKVRVVVLSIIGLVLVVVATLLMLRASGGWLGRRRGADDPALAREAETNTARRILIVAVTLFVTGIVALGVATVYTFTTDKKDPAFFSVTKNDDSVECGTYAGTVVSPPGVKVKQSEGTVVVPLSDVKKLNYATDC